MSDYNAPAADPVRKLLDWASAYPVKAAGPVACTVLGVPWMFAPGRLWELSTAHLVPFGLIYSGAGLLWAGWFELREQKLQGWLLQAGHAFRWIVPPTRRHTVDGFGEGGDGFWAWTDGSPAPRRSAAEVLAALEAETEDVQA